MIRMRSERGILVHPFLSPHFPSREFIPGVEGGGMCDDNGVNRRKIARFEDGGYVPPIVLKIVKKRFHGSARF